MIKTLIFIFIFMMPFTMAYSVVLKVNAEYSQSRDNPGKNEFRITDPCIKLPLSYFCDDNVSRVVAVDADIDKPIFRGSNAWDRFFFHSFPREKSVTLTSPTGSKVNMKFSFTHTGYTLKNVGVDIGDAYQAHPNSNCSLVDRDTASSTKTVFYSIAANAQKNGGSCYTKIYPNPIKRINAIISKYYFGYKLSADNIDTIPNGRYQGRVTLTVGSSNKDLDLGNSAYRAPSIIEMDISLVVRNQMKVEFPHGSNTVVLTPPKGWWNSTLPTVLNSRLPVRISSDTPFWIGLMCQYTHVGGGQCEIRDRSGSHRVPIVISRNNAYGKFILSPSVKVPFKNSKESANDFFLFEIEQSKVDEMRKRPGATYKGIVTLIVDATIPVGGM